jgi:flavin-binding protein dodecin
LKQDSKAILTAAAKASDALDYLEWFAVQPNSPPNAQAADLAEAEAA